MVFCWSATTFLAARKNFLSRFLSLLTFERLKTSEIWRSRAQRALRPLIPRFTASRKSIKSKIEIRKYFNPTLHGGGGTMFPPWSIIARQSSMSALNWLIFLDFVPFNIRKVLGRPFLEFFLKISKILAWTIFSDFDPKGGPFYARIKKSKKSNFFCSKSHLFSLNMNYTCSKLSFEVSVMPCDQVSSISRTFI